MKTRFIPVILSVSLIVASFNILPVDSMPEYGNLSEKTWYKTLFSKTEIKKLETADKTYSKTKTYLSKANLLFKQAKEFSDKGDEAKSVKDQNKAYKEAAKLEQKAVDAALKAYSQMFDANISKNDIYKSKLENTNFDTSIYHINAKKLFDESQKSFSQADVMYKNAQNFTGRQKYTFVKEAVILQENSLKKHELAVCLMMKDNSIDITPFKPVKKTEEDNKQTVNDQNSNLPADLAVKTDTVINTYNPEQDPNVYKSKFDIIISELTLSDTENSLSASMNAKNTEADILMNEVDNEYAIIDSIKNSAAAEPDKVKQEMIKQKAVEAEKNTFFKLIKSADLYYKSNEIKHNFYKNRLNTILNTDSAEKYTQAKKYIESSDSIYSYAETAFANSSLQFYKSEEYLQIMDAVQAQLTSIQQQENAFAIIFGFPPTELPESVHYKYKVPKNEIADNSNTANNNDTNTVVNNLQTKKYEYNYAGSFEYSVENPKPDTLVHENGLIFKIQLGVFKDILDINKYSKYSPLAFDTYKNNPYKRFAGGKFKSAEAAEILLKDAKKEGFKDAYIVAYNNGKRISLDKAKTLIAADNEYKNNSADEIKKLNNQSKNQNYEFKYKNLNYGTGKYDFAQGTDVKKTKGLVYAVQLGMYQIPKTNEELKMTSPLLEENTPEGMKFMKGPFYTYNKAAEQVDLMKKAGFDKAFVTAYADGIHISLSKAKTLEKPENNLTKNQNQKQDTIYFSVQIGAYSTKLTAEKEKQFLKIAETYKITAIADQNGLVIYSAGKYLKYEEAHLAKVDIQKKGITDCFVIAFEGKNKIPVSQALKMSGKKY